MMTTVSIDMVGSASDAGTVTSLGEAASSRLSEVSLSANAAVGRDRGSDFQVASAEALSLFRQTLEKQAAENAALDETMRAAIVSVSETLTKVDAAVDGETPAQVDAAAVGVQTTVSAAATEAQPTVNAAADGRSPAQVDAAVPPVDAFGSNASVVEGSVRSDAIGTIASTETADPLAQLPALPQQIASNATLATDLTAATALVGETLTKVDAVTAVEPQTTVNAAATEVQTTVTAATAPVDAFGSNASVVEGTVRSDAIGTIASTETADSDVQLPALPQQIASNTALATDLTAASVLVSETLTQVSAAATEAQTTVTAATAPVDAFGSNASVVEGTVRSDAIGTIASTETADSDVQLPALPQQIASNTALATDLTAATALVGEALTTVNAATTEVQTTVTAATAPVDAFVSNASVEEGTVRSDAIGTIASTEDDAAPQAADDLPEASADALVAAGVVPQVTTPVTGVETQPLQAVAAVDAVAAKAATPSADVLVQAASAVADTLLVSPGLLRGQGEVLVQLRPDVLDGTEVKISVIGRQLEVVFQPQTVDMAVLIENCRTQLTQHLAAKIVSFNVSVDVRKKRS